MKRLVLSVLVAISGLSASAQSFSLQETLDEYHMFNHLDASLTIGTTGIGFDVSTPVGDYAQLRVGYAFMPSFHKSMYFGVQVGDNAEKKYDANGNRVQTTFDKMADALEQVTGYKVEDQVEMIGMPTYNNLKVLVDVFPFKQDKRCSPSSKINDGTSQQVSSLARRGLPKPTMPQRPCLP